MGELKKWVKQNWVRIDSEGNIVGKCGTSPDKKNPDRCLPEAKARSLTKAERAATARKKKKEGKKVNKLKHVTLNADLPPKKSKEEELEETQLKIQQL